MSEWNCLEFETRWSDYHEGTLDAAAAAAMRRHAAECERCGALHAALAATLGALGELPAEAPPAQWYARMLGRTSGARRDSAARWRALLSPRFAMGLAMAVLTFSLVLDNSGAGPQGLRRISLTPSVVADNAQREAGRLRARAVSWVDDLKVVYEIESAVHANAPAPSGHSQRQADAPPGEQRA